MKSIYFLGGLPRSGNTLLSALLNQNPDIYVSPLSPLLNNLLTIEKNLNFNEVTLSVNFENIIFNWQLSPKQIPPNGGIKFIKI